MTTVAVRESAGVGLATRARPRASPRSVDAVLCLLPFEPRSMPDTLCARSSSGIRWPTRFRCRRSRQARAHALGLAADARVVAVLPGSRMARCSASALISLRPARAAGAAGRLAHREFHRAHGVARARGGLQPAGVPIWRTGAAAGAARRPGAGRCGRGAGGVGHRDAADHAAWLPDGGGLSACAADGVPGA